MPTINRSALVPYEPEKLYALVDDIQSYPEFLPWCVEATELSRDDDEVVATIALAKGSLKKSFTTRNRLKHGKMIEMRLVDGPFKHLQGFWRFDALKSDACKVALDLDYEFSSKVVALAIGPVFNQVANTLVDAFVERAREIYSG
ncbi:MAG: type II toxin-antitoxin system RatA family toxin [Gammaproteobacteria bacterium]|nr:type II toxin-antitoxin system RatA family toxin [Gammaproteobacteria bacterium]